MEVADGFLGGIANYYENFIAKFSTSTGAALNIFLAAILVAVVAMFIWRFYNSLSNKDIIKLNLSQYNKSEHPFIGKMFAILFYLVEYVVIMPILIFLWFTALSILMIIITEERSVDQILLITGGIVAAVRILAYHKKEIAKDLAKLFPFTALTIFLLTPGIFDLRVIFERLGGAIASLGNIFYFLAVIFAIEIVLRLFYTVMQLWSSEDEAVSVKKR